MTTFIYRGFAHDGARQPLPTAAPDLIYRGARHTSPAACDLKPGPSIEMVYRGVRHASQRGAGDPQFSEDGSPFPSRTVHSAESAKSAEPVSA